MVPKQNPEIFEPSRVNWEHANYDLLKISQQELSLFHGYEEKKVIVGLKCSCQEFILCPALEVH